MKGLWVESRGLDLTLTWKNFHWLQPLYCEIGSLRGGRGSCPLPSESRQLLYKDSVERIVGKQCSVIKSAWALISNPGSVMHWLCGLE